MQILISFLFGMAYAYAVIGLTEWVDKAPTKKKLLFILLSIMCAIGGFIIYNITIH